MMGMIELVKETNKMLAETTVRLRDVCSALAGPPVDKADSVPEKSHENLLDDMTFTHKQAMKLMDLTAAIECVLRGGRGTEDAGGYDQKSQSW